jgi:hypothetical protein
METASHFIHKGCLQHNMKCRKSLLEGGGARVLIKDRSTKAVKMC